MFRRKPKWGVRVVIFDERAGGGMEVSFDLARRYIDKQQPGKVFYQLKHRKIKTKPAEYYRLIPGSGGKKVLPLYGISHDEVFPLAFENLTTEEIQATDHNGNRLFYRAKPVQAKDELGNPLFHKVKGGVVQEDITTENTGKPAIGKYVQELDTNNKPIITTEETPLEVTVRRPVKLCVPTPDNLRHWLAQSQEEDKYKYEFRSWWDKYSQYITLATLGAIILIAIMFTMFGIEQIVSQIDLINEGFKEVAKSITSVANQLNEMQDIQTLRGATITPA